MRNEVLKIYISQHTFSATMEIIQLQYFGEISLKMFKLKYKNGKFFNNS